ncbi:MAG: DUF4129 domain-containing protein [Bacillota bacterium]
MPPSRISRSALTSALLRALVDACWLVPLRFIIFATFPEHAPSAPALSVLVVLLVPAVFAVLAEGYSGTPASARLPSAAILLAVWLLSNGSTFWGAREVGPQEVYFGTASALYLGMAAYRGLVAGSASGGSRFPRELIRGTLATSLVLLSLHVMELPVPLWPVLLLPTALVAVGVTERSFSTDPTSESAGLHIGGRWIVTGVVALCAIILSLVLTTALSAGFWSGVVSVFGTLWGLVASGIAYLAYPFIYVAFWIFELIRDLLFDIEPTEGSEAPKMPELPEEVAETATGAGPWATLILQIILAVSVALLIYWLFRSVTRRRERSDPGEWEEVRESLWEPGKLRDILGNLFSENEPPAPAYRTTTERQVRRLYLRIPVAVFPLRRESKETVRAFLGRLAARVPDLEKALADVRSCYEKARYGPPIEDDSLVTVTRGRVEEIVRSWDREIEETGQDG